MNQNEGKDARGASRLHAELGQQAFDMAVIELLGPAALTGGTMSLLEAARIFWNAGITMAATFCDKRATMCGDRADLCDDDAIELKARAWQMKVMAAEINSMTVPNALAQGEAQGLSRLSPGATGSTTERRG